MPEALSRVPEKIRGIISIGIIGQQGAGKSKATEIFEHFWPGKRCTGIIVIAFADTIKDEIAQLGINPLIKTPEVRHLLQEYGARMRLEHGQDYWIRKTEERCFAFLSPDTVFPKRRVVFIHPDVRLFGEAEWIRKKKYGLRRESGFLIRMLASKQTRQRRIIARSPRETLAWAKDVTETEQLAIKADFEVNNDGTLENLTDQLIACMIQMITRAARS